MKNNKNCYERRNKNGELISYRFFCMGKDPLTEQPKQYTKTWKIPHGLSHKEIEYERKKAELEFIKLVEKKSVGLFVEENNITFEEYSTQWLNRILLRNPEAYSYYERALNALKVINQNFGQCLIRKINPSMVQKFYDYLCTRTYKKQVVTVKKSLYDVIDVKQCKNKIASLCGIERHTLNVATTIGKVVNISTAKAICKYFNIPLSKCFDVKQIETKYAKSTNAGIRTILVVILGEAKREQLVEHNYASKDFTRPITGTSHPKEVFDANESKEFVKAVLNEPHQKKKTIFSLLIFLGLRKAEVCGLSWRDIDFDNQTLSVTHNSLYLRSFGIVTKGTKTKTSKRSLKLPEQMLNVLAEYKLWYDKQKELHGDLWENTDRLFIGDNGKPMNPCTIDKWLKDFNLKHGFKLITPHEIRHTCITNQINAGIPLKVVSTRAGHANEKITFDIYTHSLKSQDDEAAEIYNNYLIS